MTPAMHIYQWVPDQQTMNNIRPTLHQLNPLYYQEIEMFVGQDYPFTSPENIHIVVRYPELVVIQHLRYKDFFSVHRSMLYTPLPLNDNKTTSFAYFGLYSHKKSTFPLPRLFISDIWQKKGILSHKLCLTIDLQTRHLVYTYGSIIPCLLITHRDQPLIRTIMMDILTVLPQTHIDAIKKQIPFIQVITVPKREKYVKLFLEVNHLEHAILFPAIRPEKAGAFLTKGETGCFLSHLKVLEKFQNIGPDEHVLILEDDVQVSNSLSGMWVGDFISHFMSKLPKDWQFIFLGYCFDHCRHHQRQSSQEYIELYTPRCSHAYMLKGQVISKLLSHKPQKIQKPYDQFLTSVLRKEKIKMYAPTDMTVFDQNPSFQSTLDNPWDVALRKYIFQPRCIETIYSSTHFMFMVLGVFMVIICLLFVSQIM